MNKNIALIGMPGAGKSSVGRELAYRTGLIFADTDAAIEERESKSIAEIFADSGETAFRSIESEVIRFVSELDGAVISCGGGAVISPENVKVLRENCCVVYLSATEDTLCERVEDDGTRPLLDGDCAANISRLYRERAPLYAAACHIEVSTDGRDVKAIAEEALAKLQILQNSER